MIPRIERRSAAPKTVLKRRQKGSRSGDADLANQLALAYSNGYVTVEISQEALDAYIDLTGDVPLPVSIDPETGDRRTYDARNKVRVVYDADAQLREISTRSGDGLFVRINFTNEALSDPP